MTTFYVEVLKEERTKTRREVETGKIIHGGRKMVTDLAAKPRLAMVGETRCTITPNANNDMPEDVVAYLKKNRWYVLSAPRADAKAEGKGEDAKAKGKG